MELTEEEQEFHVCHVCGADDILSEPFYKDSFGQYWCPACREEHPETEMLPCTCGTKPIVYLEHGSIFCPNCRRYQTTGNFIVYPPEMVVEEWNRHIKAEGRMWWS